MNKQLKNSGSMKYLYTSLALFILMAFSLQVQGQSTTVFTDDFNRADYSYGGNPAMSWTTYSSINPTNIQITSNIFRIANNNATANTGVPGRTYITGPLSTFHPLYKSKLADNVADVIWTVNMRTMKSELLNFEVGNTNYATAIVLTASNADLLASGTNGYALVFLQVSSSNRPNPRLVRFENGLNSNTNLTTIVGPSDTGVSTNYYSYKVVYSPDTDSWKLFYRLDGASSGGSFKDPAVEDATNGYYTEIGTSAVDNTYTNVEMAVCGFFHNHGISSTATSGRVQFDNFKVTVAADAQSIDATLSDLQVSLDGTNFETLTMFNSATKTYQYYLTKGHAIPTVSATKNDPAASEPVIAPATNLQGTQAERTTTITVTAEDESVVDTYSIEFIETDYIFISGLGDANGLTEGGLNAAPPGWTHSLFTYSGIITRGNNKFEGLASVRQGTTSTYAWLQLPAMTEIGTLDFYVRKNHVNVAGNIKVTYQKDGGDWIEAADFGDVGSLEYVKLSAVINQRAISSLLVRVELTKNGDVFADAGYYFDDFAYTEDPTPSNVASLSDLKVSLDGENYNSLGAFNPLTKSYVYYLTKNHAVPLISATTTDPDASDKTVIQATNLKGTQAERTATVNITAEDGVSTDTYTIEFVETENVYQSGMGNANGTTVGGGGAEFIPAGWTHSNMYFSGVIADGNNKFEGPACVRLATTSTVASLTLPPMSGIGTLRFFARKFEEGVVGNIKVLMQKDGGDWVEVTDLGDIENMTYQEFIVPINQVATTSMLVRIEVTKNGDTFASRGYFFDDFSYTAADFGTSSQLTKEKNYVIRNEKNGLVIDIEAAQVAIYNPAGMLLQQAQVDGSHKFSNLSSGIYLVRISDINGSHTVKHIIY